MRGKKQERVAAKVEMVKAWIKQEKTEERLEKLDAALEGRKWRPKPKPQVVIVQQPWNSPRGKQTCTPEEWKVKRQLLMILRGGKGLPKIEVPEPQIPDVPEVRVVMVSESARVKRLRQVVKQKMLEELEARKAEEFRRS